mgnify:CR=1 FL=1
MCFDLLRVVCLTGSVPDGEDWMQDLPDTMTSKKLGRRAARIIAGDETLAAMSKHNWQNKVIRVSTHWSGVDGTPLITLVRVRE